MTSNRPTRRRFLRIMAAAPVLATTASMADDRSEWRGSALGAEISIVFDGLGRKSRQAAIERIMAEIERQEAIFSLQDARSELSRLNAAARLDSPSPDMLHLLSVSREIHKATNRRFDPTVQSLWRFYVEWYGADRARSRPPDIALARCGQKVGFDEVHVGPNGVEMPRNFALTLNGIAQGHITDRGVAILKDLGFTRVLADLGEIGAIGPRATGDSWRIARPDGATIPLQDAALSTSAGSGTRLADNGDHHIFDPVSLRPARIWNWMSVAHPSATIADGLSTGLYCLSPEECVRAIGAFPGIRFWGQMAEGRIVELTA